MAVRIAAFATCLVLLSSGASRACGRGLAQFYPETFTNEEVNNAVSAAKNATAAARTLIILAQAVEAELTVANTQNEFLAGHVAADAVEGAGEVGQVSSAAAAADASASTAIATVAALTKSAADYARAQQVIELAEAATAQIRQEDNSTLPASTSASLRVFARTAHDGSLVLYWNNLTNAMPADGETYNETVYFIAGLEPDSNETIVDFINQEVTAGANPAIGLSLLHVIMHQMLGAIHTYKNDLNATLAEQLEVSNSVLKAAQIIRSNAPFDAAALQTLADSAQDVLKQGQDSGDAAASGAPTAAADIDAVLTAVQALDARIETGLNGVATPAMAPSSGGASAAGR